MLEFTDTLEIGKGYVLADEKTNMPRRKLTFMAVAELLRETPQPADPIPGFLYPEYPDNRPPMGPPPEAEEGDGVPSHGPGFAHEPEVIETIRPEDIVHRQIRIDCDAVVVSGGRCARRTEAAAFRGTAAEIYVVGDNVIPGSIQECTLTGFAAGMAL